jgi:hypothetical protein
VKLGARAVFWGILLVGLGLVAMLPLGGRTNCILWALDQHTRKGGKIVFLKSKYGWWFHAAWTKDGWRFLEYVPLARKTRRRWYQVPLLFHGRVRRWRL